MVILSRLVSLIKTLRHVRPWRVRIWIQKRFIHLQERFGWYSYSQWKRFYSERAREHFAARKTRDPDQQLIFSIFLYPRSDISVDPVDGGMIQSLQNSSWQQWNVHHLSRAHGRAGTQFAGSLPSHNLTGEPPNEPRCLVRTAQEWIAMIQSVEGDWIGFWGHDDAVEPDLFSTVVQSIDDTTDIVYFDEDCFTGSAAPVYHSPFFKPDWSPELLISVNYARHALFRRQSLLRGLAGVDHNAKIDLDDLTYLGCEKAQKIVHLPGPHYHIRADQPDRGIGSLSPSAFPAGIQAVAAHLEREGMRDPQVMMTGQGHVHVTWSTQEKLVSIIIPTKDKVAYLERCIRSIQEVNHYSNWEVIVVDSGSQEEATQRYYELLRKDSKVQIVDYQGAFNYSRANNLGVEHARGDLLLFLNNDVEAIEPDWLYELVQWAERPQVGIVGAKLLYPDGVIQHAGIVLGMEGHASHVFSGMVEGSSGPFGSVEWYRNYLAVTAACMMMRKEVFESIGGFDEAYELVFGDVEICVRAVEKGYRVMYNPFARLIHHEGKTRGRQMISGDIHKAFDRLKDQVEAGDPYYNRYLTHTVRTPALRRDWEDQPLRRLERIVRDY